jgi:MSHA biogenesis protein MshN
MSLVNKMLRDLDARRVGDGERAALPAAVTPLTARQEHAGSGPLLWVGALAALVAVAGAAWFGAQVGSGEPPAARPLPASPLPGAPPIPAPTAPEPVVVAPITPAAADGGASSLRMADQLSVVPPLPEGPPARAATPPAKPVERPAASDAGVRPPTVSMPKVPPVPEPRIDKQVRMPSATERADIDYRRGILAQRQGDADGAANGYRAALDIYPEHAAARQALATLLIEAKHFDEAEDVLRKGTELAPLRLASVLAWARLKVERNQAPAALDILQKHAAAGERSAEYQGFTGALLNRAGRAAEAADHYQAATRLAPSEGRWWAGLGIALEAAGKVQESREAYLKARALPGLPADLAQHIEQRLR